MQKSFEILKQFDRIQIYLILICKFSKVCI